MRCATHFKVETNLGCGKCGKAICPKCLVQTPVGARCRDCANLDRLPTYRVSSKHYLRAIATGLGMAALCGVAWGAVAAEFPFFFPFLNLLLASAVGYAIGEVISLAVNRKRGRGLSVVGGTSVALSYLVSYLVMVFLFGGITIGLLMIMVHLVALALGIYIAITRLR